MTADANTVDLTGRQPQWPEDATRLWVECIALAIGDDRHSRTPPRAGLPELRAEIGERWGMDPERMVLTTGVRGAAALLALPGDIAFAEGPGFSGIPAALRGAGAEVTVVSWEDMTAKEHPAPLSQTPSQKAWCWVTSPCRNPDGAALTPSLAAELRGHRLVINEIYRPFAPDAPIEDAAVRVASLAKVAGGGSRLGWLTVAPDELDLLLDRHVNWPATLTQLAWVRFLRRGGLELLQETYVAAANAARAAFVTAAEDVLDCGARSARGCSLLLRAAEPGIAEVLRSHGLLAGPGPDFLTTAERVRLCFTDVTLDEAVDAAERLVMLFKTGALRLPAG